MCAIAHVGALIELSNHIPLKAVKEWMGVSAGSLMAMCLCIGFTLKELEDFCVRFDFTNIKEYLLSVPADVGHVNVCNKTFSHNDYVLKEKELLIEKLIKCGGGKDNSNAAGDHCWTKSFVKKSAFESYTNVHYANIKKDYKRTDVLFDENNIHSEKNRTLKPIFDKIRINHYRWRDYHYAFEKVAMYEKWGQLHFTLSLAKTFEEDYDYEIHKYFPKLKERMGIE
jgi:hypothetical protein